MDLRLEVERIEKELLIIITTHLQEKKISQDEAQKLAQDFLKILPVKDKFDLLQKLKLLAGTYEEAKPLYIIEKNKVFQEGKEKILTEVSHLIKNGGIEQATTLIKHHTQEESL